MRSRQHVHCDAAWKPTCAADFDPIVKNGNGNGAAWLRIVTMHDGVEENLAQRVGRNRESVFTKDLSFCEMGGQRQGAIEERHSFTDHGKSVQVLLPVIQDIARNLRPAKAS